MNGARTTFMRTGYWLTALGAIVLLAASAGTASAQITAKVDPVAEGDSARITFTAKATIEPGAEAGSITVTVGHAESADGTHEAADVVGNPGTAELRFPAGEAEGADAENKLVTITGTAVLQTTHDPDAEDETVVLTYMIATSSGFTEPNGQVDSTQALTAPADESFTIKDDETQTYVLAVSPASHKPTEGTGVTVSLSAMPAHEDDDADLTVNIDKPAPAYSMAITQNSADVPGNVVIIGTGTTASATITVTQADPDGNRASDTVELTAYSGRAGASKLEASLAITIADLHALPSVTAMVVGEDGKALDPQPEYVAEGKSVMFKVMVLNDDGKPGGIAAEDLKVALSPSGSADARDYRLSLSTVDIGMGTGESAAVTLMAELDEDVGPETLVLNATVSGTMANGTETSPSDGVLSIDIMDNTEKQITPKSSDADYDRIKAATADLNPGGTVELMTSDLFDVAEGFSASYSVSVEGTSVSAFASGEVVTINAEVAGESKITVTGTASMSSSSLMPSQDVSNVASLTFPVMVVDTDLVVTLSAEPMEIAAGGTTMITATANRAVTVGDGDVEIALAVVGDGTLDAESIMIAMGDMSGSAMLTANESVTVVATGSGVTGLMQVAVTVTVTDAPDPDAPDPDAPDPDAPDPDAPEPENQISSKSQDEAYPVDHGRDCDGGRRR